MTIQNQTVSAPKGTDERRQEVSRIVLDAIAKGMAEIAKRQGA